MKSAKTKAELQKENEVLQEVVSTLWHDLVEVMKQYDPEGLKHIYSKIQEPK